MVLAVALAAYGRGSSLRASASTLDETSRLAWKWALPEGACCTCSVCTVTPLCLGVWRASFVKAWRCGSGGRSGSGDVVGGAVLPVVDGVKVDGVVMDGVKVDGAVVIDHSGTVAPMVLIMMAVFANTFTYGTITY